MSRSVNTCTYTNCSVIQLFRSNVVRTSDFHNETSHFHMYEDDSEIDDVQKRARQSEQWLLENFKLARVSLEPIRNHTNRLDSAPAMNKWFASITNLLLCW